MINILDKTLINRISAGEVVERPASIVKELLDNAIDAKSTKIIIEIKGGGIDYISVEDNGSGIEEDDLIKAFLPHATSKILKVEDLDEIASLGFRGEALASISSVSAVECISKRKDVDYACRLEVIGGEFSKISHTASNNGTKIISKNLFFNTPARRKFLKKPKSEENEITNLVSRYILSHTDISFVYKIDGKEYFRTTGKTLKDALYCVYGEEVLDSVMEIKAETSDMSLSGFSSVVGFSKPNTTYQTLIVNGRYVVDEIVSKAVFSAYEEYLMHRQYPFYVLNLNLPLGLVDVNVHPSKLNIKFAKPNEIFSFIYKSIRSAIYKAQNENSGKFETSSILYSDEQKVSLSDFKREFKQNNQINNNFKNESALSSRNENEKVDYFENKIKDSQIQNNNSSSFMQSLKEIEVEPIKLDNNLVLKEPNDFENNYSKLVGDIKPVKETQTSMFDGTENKLKFSNLKIIGEVFNEFIILEYQNSLLFLDFHAGHERLRYDNFCEMIKKEEIVVQDMLIPYIRELSLIEMEYFEQIIPNLQKLGFYVEQFGEKAIRFSAVPLIFKDLDLKEYTDAILSDMKNMNPKLDKTFNDYLMKKACKGAVKAGMTLKTDEIEQLLKDIDLKNPVLLCPHGRPIIYKISKEQFEKWFRRIV